MKGRDFYDYQWYLSKGIRLNLDHVAARMRQSGLLEKHETLDADALLLRLQERFRSVNYEQAKRDVLPCIKNPSSIDFWSAEYFIAITRDRLQLS